MPEHWAMPREIDECLVLYRVNVYIVLLFISLFTLVSSPLASELFVLSDYYFQFDFFIIIRKILVVAGFRTFSMKTHHIKLGLQSIGYRHILMATVYVPNIGRR